MPKGSASGGGDKKDWKDSGSFIRKPASGWLHADWRLDDGVIYRVKYIGCVKILKSMKTIPNESRGDIVRDAIIKCCDVGGVISAKKNKHSRHSDQIIGESFNGYCGEIVEVNISKQRIKIRSVKTGVDMSLHDITSISFASAGEKEYSNMVAYVAKDVSFERACFVFECGKKEVQSVIHTIGQAFEVKFKEYLNTPLKVTEVPERFTNPIFPMTDANDDTSEKYAPLFTGGSESEGQYASHYAVPKSSNIMNTGAVASTDTFGDGYSRLQHNAPAEHVAALPGYDRLMHHNQQSPGTGPQDMMFTAGDHYSDPNIGFSEYAAVYDNPIASSPARPAGDTKVIYDNPVNLLPDMFPDQDQSNGVQNWTTFEDNSQKQEYQDPEGYLVPAGDSKVRRNQDEDDDDDDGDYQPVPTRDEYQKPNPLANESWFHGNIKREEAEAVIRVDGDFLVRESSSSKGQYVLSGMQDGHCRHLLLVDPQGKVRTKDRVFKDVPELVAFHLKNNVPIISGGSSVFLKQEVKKVLPNRASVAI